jgi:hypothetical protein
MHAQEHRAATPRRPPPQLPRLLAALAAPKCPPLLSPSPLEFHPFCFRLFSAHRKLDPRPTQCVFTTAAAAAAAAAAAIACRIRCRAAGAHLMVNGDIFPTGRHHSKYVACPPPPFPCIKSRSLHSHQASIVLPRFRIISRGPQVLLSGSKR